jgi:hypothetical protein
MDYLIWKSFFVFSPSGYEQSDIPMPIGTVEKLFEPSASSFTPGGRLIQIRFVLNTYNVQCIHSRSFQRKKLLVSFVFLQKKLARKQSGAKRF